MCASFPSSGPEGGRPHFLLAGRAVPYYNGTKNTSVVSSSDRPLEGGLLLKEWKAKLHDLTAIVPRGVMNFLITAFFMAGAYYLSRLLFQFGVENNSALVYVLAVTFVSWLTTGYFYGILASLFSSFCINYYFMYPYSAFSLSYAGYPVAMLSMTAIAIIICTLTGLTIIVSGVWTGTTNGAEMTQSAFATTYGSLAPFILTISLTLFAFTTIIGWNYYGERCWEYLFGTKTIKLYRIGYIAILASAVFLKLEAIWSLADIVNGLMAIPNLIALLGLSGVITAETKKYFNHLAIRDAKLKAYKARRIGKK